MSKHEEEQQQKYDTSIVVVRCLTATLQQPCGFLWIREICPPPQADSTITNPNCPRVLRF